MENFAKWEATSQSKLPSITRPSHKVPQDTIWHNKISSLSNYEKQGQINKSLPCLRKLKVSEKATNHRRLGVPGAKTSFFKEFGALQAVLENFIREKWNLANFLNL